MKSIGKFLGRVFRYLDEKLGVSTVEYALIVVAVVGIVGASAALMGDAFEELFNDLTAELGTAVDDVKNQVVGNPGGNPPANPPAPPPANPPPG